VKLENARFYILFGLIFFAAVSFDSTVSVWGEHRPVGGWFEEFIARTINFGFPLAALAAGIFAGARVAERSRRNWIGWIVGIAAFYAVGGLLYFAASRIPGVDWRFERLRQD
jgi:drug/metabolite transporter (DMT)-like permease